jgi:hypothetical protein
MAARSVPQTANIAQHQERELQGIQTKFCLSPTVGQALLRLLVSFTHKLVHDSTARTRLRAWCAATFQGRPIKFASAVKEH